MYMADPWQQIVAVASRLTYAPKWTSAIDPTLAMGRGSIEAKRDGLYLCDQGHLCCLHWPFGAVRAQQWGEVCAS